MTEAPHDPDRPDVRRICVFCGSNSGSSGEFARAAAALGGEIARRGVELVFGGGRVGLMGLVADAAMAAGGRVIGVIPQHLMDREVGHEDLSELVVTASMHERKAEMARLADGFIALPGGFGTFEEVLEILTWNQLGLVRSPVVFLDVEGFFEPLLAAFDRAVDTGFVRPLHRRLAQVARTPAEAVTLALAEAPPPASKWIDLEHT